MALILSLRRQSRALAGSSWAAATAAGVARGPSQRRCFASNLAAGVQQTRLTDEQFLVLHDASKKEKDE